MTVKLADLSLLAKPLKMTIPDLGDLFVDLHGGFQDWLAAGLDKGRWTDGDDLICAILAEQARTAEAEDTPTTAAEIVVELEPTQLEAAAGAFLVMSGLALRPKWVRREGGGRRLRARKRREDETYDMAAREGEPERDRLFRIARDWREDCRLRDAELTAMALGPHHDELVEAARRADEFDRLTRAAGLAADTYRTAFETAKGIDASAVLAAQAALKGFDFAGAAAAQKALRGFDVSGLSAAQKAFQAVDVSSLLGMQRHFADVTRAMSIGAEIARLTQVNRPAYDALSQVLAEQTRSIQAAMALTRGPELGAAAQALTTLTGPRGYFEDLRKHLHIVNPAAGLAALAAAQVTAWPPTELRDALANVTALRPGFQMTAALGLTATAPRGVAADVLRLYEVEPDPATPVFAAAVRTAHAADVTEPPDDQVAQLWATIHDLQAQVACEKDPVRRHGLYDIIMMIGMFLGLLLAGAGVYEAHAARLADQTDREQQAAFEREMRQAQAEARSEVAERYRTGRYVATDGPLRTEPYAYGPVLQVVYAGQLAVAKDQRDGWVLVEVFSYAPEQSVVGWLPARRLRVSR